MNQAEKESLQRLARALRRLFAGTLTARIRKDPAGFARDYTKLEMRFHDKAQKLGASRRECYKLRLQVQALKNENSLLFSRLRNREQQKPEPAEQQPPESAHAASAE